MKTKRAEPSVSIHVRLPRSLANDVHLLLMNPAQGRTRYGQLTTLIERMLHEWVAEVKRTGVVNVN